LDGYRLNLFSYLIRFLFNIGLLAVLPALWRFLRGNCFLVCAVTILETVLVSFPLELIRSKYILGKYDKDVSLTEIIGSVGFAALAAVIPELILTAVLYGVSKCTKLNDPEPPPDDPAPLCRCRGKFWVIITVGMCVLLIGIELSIVDIYVAFIGENLFVPIGASNETDAAKLALRQLVSKNNFPYEDVYIQLEDDGPNAVFMGIAKKRIIIFKSLIELVNVAELCGTVAHEIGHWKHGHIISAAFLSLILVMVIGLLFKLLSGDGLAAFGFEAGCKPVMAIFFIVGLASDSFRFLELPIMNTFTRNHEYDADCFAAGQNYAIGAALTKLSAHLESEVESLPIYEWFYLDHPQLSNRLKHINTCAP
jgi:Zn-dependent protease with chaperone function